MTELGRILFEARSVKELSLADVEAGTRIRQKYLEALESGRYEELPRGATARGFLRNLARYLDLDEEGIVQLYIQESGDEEAELPLAEAAKSRQIDYRPLEVELMDVDRPMPWWRWVVALLVVGLLAAVIWWYLAANSRGTPLALFAAPSTATATQTATPTFIWTSTPTPTIRPSHTAVPTASPSPSDTPSPSPSPDQTRRQPLFLPIVTHRGAPHIP